MFLIYNKNSLITKIDSLYHTLFVVSIIYCYINNTIYLKSL